MNMIKPVFLLSIILLSLTSIVSASSGGNVAQMTYPNSYVIDSNIGVDVLFQTVTLQPNLISIDNLGIYIKKTGSPGNLQVHFGTSTGVGGSPDIVLDENIVSSSTISTSPSWVIIESWYFSSYSDYQYFFYSLECYSGCDGSNYYTVYANTTGNYADGSAFTTAAETNLDPADLSFYIDYTYDEGANSVAWKLQSSGADVTSVSIGNTLLVNSSVAIPDFDSYWYRAYVFDEDNSLRQIFNIESATSSSTYTTTGIGPGIYTVKLFSKSKSSGLAIELASDTIDIHPVEDSDGFIDIEYTNYNLYDTITVDYGIDNTWFDFLGNYKMSLYIDNVLQDEVMLDSPMGSRTFPALKVGIYTVKLEFGIWTWVIIDEDTAIVTLGQSYIQMSKEEVTAGILTNVTYKWGFTPTQSGFKWIYVDYLDPETSVWIRESSYAVTGTVKDTLYTTQILSKKEGRYKITLCDLYINCNAAFDLYDAIIGGNIPIDNYTASRINISNKLSSYSQGDYLNLNYEVRGYDFSDKTVTIEIMNNESSSNKSIYNVQKESDTLNIFLGGSISFESGASQLLLIGTNDTARYILASDNLIMSVVDSEGYGLESSDYSVCAGEPVIITSILPVGVNGTIRWTDDNGIKQYNVSGTRTFRIKPVSDMTVSLDVGEIQKKMISIDVGDCIVDSTDSDGDGILDDEESSDYTTSGGFDLFYNIKTAVGYYLGESEATLFLIGCIIIGSFAVALFMLVRHTAAGVFGGLLGLGVSTMAGFIPMIWAVMIVVIVGFLFMGMMRQG